MPAPFFHHTSSFEYIRLLSLCSSPYLSILFCLTGAENLELTVNILLPYCRQVVQHGKHGSSRNSCNSQKTPYEICLPTGQGSIGFYNTDWTHCQLLFPNLGLYMSASYWTSLSAPLGSVYLLYTVCNLMFSYFRIFKRVFCECCHLPRDLSVFFSVDWENSSWSLHSKQASGTWVSDNNLAPAYLPPKDVLCSITFVLNHFLA